MFKLIYCKSRMVAFVNDQLPPKARRRVARYIDECPKCYALYRSQRALADELKATLPVFGQAENAQLQNIWSAVQVEITAPPPARLRYAYRTSYAIAMLATALVMILPLMLGNSTVSARAQITLPEPVNRLALVSSVTPANTTQTITATAEPQMTDEGEVTLTITPRPVLEPNEN